MTLVIVILQCNRPEANANIDGISRLRYKIDRYPRRKTSGFCGGFVILSPRVQEETAKYTTHCILPSGGTWEIARPETGCEYSGD